MSEKSREHRQRVLEHQAKLAAERGATHGLQRDGQLAMPLIVEVKDSPKKPRARRPRRNAQVRQLGLDEA
jgi:hypothetical protein